MLQFPRKEERKGERKGKKRKKMKGKKKKRKGTRKRKRRKKKKQGEEGKGIVFGSIVGGEIRIKDRSVLQRNFALSQISSDI